MSVRQKGRVVFIIFRDQWLSTRIGGGGEFSIHLTSLIEATAVILVVVLSAVSSKVQRKSLFRPLSCSNNISDLGIVW